MLASGNSALPTIDLVPDLRDAPLYRADDFVPGFLRSAIPFWRDVIIELCSKEKRDTLLGWIQGVSIHEFVDPQKTDIFQGKPYNGAELSAVELPNHVPVGHDTWVNQEIGKLVEKGCLARWAEVADTNKHPRPHIVLPHGVEPSKPRLIWDGRWLNLMCKHSAFTMDGVGKVAQCAWPGAYQVTLDHKADFHHVPLNVDSWQYFGLRWEDVYYVWAVL